MSVCQVPGVRESLKYPSTRKYKVLRLEALVGRALAEGEVGGRAGGKLMRSLGNQSGHFLPSGMREFQTPPEIMI